MRATCDSSGWVVLLLAFNLFVVTLLVGVAVWVSNCVKPRGWRCSKLPIYELHKWKSSVDRITVWLNVLNARYRKRDWKEDEKNLRFIMVPVEETFVIFCKYWRLMMRTVLQGKKGPEDCRIRSLLLTQLYQYSLISNSDFIALGIIIPPILLKSVEKS